MNAQDPEEGNLYYLFKIWARLQAVFWYKIMYEIVCILFETLKSNREIKLMMKFKMCLHNFFELWNLCSPVLLRNSFFLLIQGSINILEGLLKGAHNLVSSPYFLVNPAHSALFPSKSRSHPLFKNNNKSKWNTWTPTHGAASTLRMRTAISPGQWQPWTAASALLGLISMA